MPVDVIRAAKVDPRAPGLLEIVERKGRGHPDTLCERLAEELSRTYCALTRERFGTILRHQFDKLVLMGGRCDVWFGGGQFRSPIRLLINGRLTARLGNDRLAFRDAIFAAAQLFLEAELRSFEFTVDCRVILETSSNQTRGIRTGSHPGSAPVHHRFRPRTLADIPEHVRPLANDTSLGCAWAPYSELEELVLRIEGQFTSDAAQSLHPWIGTDVKIMARRVNRKVGLTVSVPQVSSQVKSAAEYSANMKRLEAMIGSLVSAQSSFDEVAIDINPGDDLEQEEIYMKFTGSSIESGDEGVVGRGNRIGGLISACRPYTMEGISGKNPSYHAGKLYSAAAWEVANRVWGKLGVPCEVFLASQMDRPLDDPWTAVVRVFGDASASQIELIVNEVTSDIQGLTDRILEGRFPFA